MPKMFHEIYFFFQDEKWREIYADMHKNSFSFDLDKPITEEDLTDLKPHEHLKHGLHKK